MKLNEKKILLLCALILFLAFALGLAVTSDYGIPPDENTEIGILMGNLREYLGLYFKEDSLIMYGFDANNYIPISQSIEIDHGQAAYYPISPLLYLAKTNQIEIGSDSLSLIYHLYTYIISFTAVIAIFVLVKDLFKNPVLALLCALMLFISPRFFGEMHYNNKDIVLLALVIDTCCLGILATKYCRAFQVFFFSLLAALTANTKIVGLYVYGVIGLFYLVYTSVYKRWSERSRIKAMLASIVMFCGFYYLLTPAMWRDVAGFFDYCIFNAFQFSRWDGLVLFEGKALSPASGELPGRYLVTLISITTPMFILGLAVLGAGRFLFCLASRKHRKNRTEILLTTGMICLCTLLPLLVASISKSIVYNGWRHFYFSYFGILMLAFYGMELLFCRWKKVSAFAVICFMAANTVQTVANHPYQFAYFNLLAGKDAGYRYETDYWGVSTRDAIELILEDSPDDGATAISWGTDTTRLLLINAYNVLPTDEAMRVDLVYDYSSADYIVVNSTRGIVYGTDIPEDFYLMHTIEAYGVPLTDIYARSEH